MAISNQTSTRFKDEIRIIAPWVFFFAGFLVLLAPVLFVVLAGQDPHAPPVPLRVLLGILGGGLRRVVGPVLCRASAAEDGFDQIRLAQAPEAVNAQLVGDRVQVGQGTCLKLRALEYGHIGYFSFGGCVGRLASHRVGQRRAPRYVVQPSELLGDYSATDGS